ncbi:Transport and Golgi organization 2 [Carabus blaptoides fortunei]
MNPKPDKGQYRLILATNRDEYYARPAGPAHVWPEAEHIIAGTDLETGREGGTWFGVSVREQQLRTGALLNVTGEPRILGAPGRGCIVTDYLRGSNTTLDYVTNLRADTGRIFNAYTFVTVELGLTSGNVYCYNNVADELTTHGTNGDDNDNVWYACGNSLQHEPLAKVSMGALRFRNTVEQLQAAVSERETLIGELMALLKWTVPHIPDPVLERRVPSAEVRHSLSSVFVSMPNAGYGTRTHTILLVDHTGRVEFLEDTMYSGTKGSSITPTSWHHSEHLAQL